VSQARNYERSERLENGHRSRATRAAVGYGASVAASVAVNSTDRELVSDLLDDPHHNCDAVRRRLAELLAWLEGHDHRSLFPGQRLWLKNVRIVLHANARHFARFGVIPPFNPDPTKKPRRSTLYSLPKRTPLPAWMNDPSLLPKRPPGAPQQ
jgi:hypothetical protein